MLKRGLWVVIFISVLLATNIFAQKPFEVTEIKVVSRGNKINDFKLGFLPPVNAEETKQVFQAWLMMYSTKTKEEVEKFLKSLSIEELERLWDTKGANRIYRITNFGYADGAGNTFRTGQKDVVTGKDFGPGLYYFYVATLGKDGILALGMAKETVDIRPFPIDVKLSGTGNKIENYQVNFSSHDDERIVGNFVFFSRDVIFDVQKFLKDKTLSDILELDRKNRGVFTKELSGPVHFRKLQRELSGDLFGKGVYYVYVASVGKDGVLGISQAIEMIITANMPFVSRKPIGDGKGTLVLGGGATSDGKAAEAFFGAILQATQKDKPKLAYINSGRPSVFDIIDRFYNDERPGGSDKKWLEELGFEPVLIPVALDSAHFVADHIYFAELIKSCDAVYISGGDQFMHARALLRDDGSDTEILKAIRFVYRKGGVIAGTSAGMHIMSNPNYGVGLSYNAMYYNQTEFYKVTDIPKVGYLDPKLPDNSLATPGFGLIDDYILTDSHFDYRGRLGRFVVALRDMSKKVGIASDEGTAFVLKDGVGTVVGLSGVFIVDVSNAKYSKPGNEEKFWIKDVKIHYLTDGDKFNLRTDEIILSKDKKIIEKTTGSTYSSKNIFGGNYEIAKVLLNFINSSESEVTSLVDKPKGFKEEDPVFAVKFRKTSETKAYISEETYVDGAKELENYRKASVINLSMDIGELPRILGTNLGTLKEGTLILESPTEVSELKKNLKVVPSDTLIKFISSKGTEVEDASKISGDMKIVLNSKGFENVYALSISKIDSKAPKVSKIWDEKYYIYVEFDEEEGMDPKTLISENITLVGNEFYYVSDPSKNVRLTNTPGLPKAQLVLLNEPKVGDKVIFTSKITNLSGIPMIEETWEKTDEGWKKIK